MSLLDRRLIAYFILAIGHAVLMLSQIGCAMSNAGVASYLEDYPAIPQQGFVNMVVEIPAGTNEKWEVSTSDGLLQLDQESGQPRVIQYLAYPVSYGMIPRTSLPKARGGDGDPLDVMLLGPRVDRGTVVEVRPIGVLRLIDDGERDDKILCVAREGPLSEVVDVDGLEVDYPGALTIIETWFTSYKGRGRTRSNGFDGAAAATEIIHEAVRCFEDDEGSVE